MTDVELAREEIDKLNNREEKAVTFEKVKLRHTLKGIRLTTARARKEWQAVITLAEKMAAAKQATADIMGDDTLAENDK